MDEPGAMTDAAIDKEIQAALAVAPSPDFLARVRQRIALEPAPSSWWRRPALAMVTAALVIAAGMWSMPRRSTIGVPPDAAPVTMSAPPVLAVDLPANVSAPDIAAPPDVGVPLVRTPGPPPAAPRFPPVLLAENERAALRMLGAATRLDPPEPSEIMHATERAASARPELPPVSFDAPDMGRPLFEAVGLE